jgi:hypothetical protein
MQDYLRDTLLQELVILRSGGRGGRKEGRGKEEGEEGGGGREGGRRGCHQKVQCRRLLACMEDTPMNVEANRRTCARWCWGFWNAS